MRIRNPLGPPRAAPKARGARRFTVLYSPVWALLLCCVVLLAPASLPAAAGSRAPQVSSEDCLLCHSDTSAARSDGSSVFVDLKKFSESIHGQLGLDCASCHADPAAADPPHPEKLDRPACGACHEKAKSEYDSGIHAQRRAEGSRETATCWSCHGSHDIRAASDPYSRAHPLRQPETCGVCHSKTIHQEPVGISWTRGYSVYDLYSQSAHGKVLKKSGLTVTATCTTCHGSHDTRASKDPQSRVARRNLPELCGRCHVGIYTQFMDSVHGQDFRAGNTDVPVCTDCHMEHAIQAAGEAGSSVSAGHMAETCSRCHEDMRLADIYGLATERFRTYGGTYHGIAMQFGQTTVANCASCHGFHDILPSSDVRSSIHPDNLAATCGKCHRGAGDNFALVKIHQVDVRQDNVWAYWVKEIYVWLISVLIGGFALFIFSDLYARARGRHPHGEGV